jgi:cytochrome c-type protein NapC
MDGRGTRRTIAWNAANCHANVAIELSNQTERGTRFLLSGEATCIDCLEVIAHELPNMEGVDPGWKMSPELEGEQLPGAWPIYALRQMAKCRLQPHGQVASRSICWCCGTSGEERIDVL